MPFLRDVHVLELYPTVAVSMAGRYLADLGATVTVVEPPGGLPMRSAPPPHPETSESLLFAYLQSGKESAVYDHTQETARATLREAIAASALVLHPFTAAEIVERTGWNPAGAPISVAITPFSELGPRQDEHAGELAVAASSGLLWMTGYPDAPPTLPYGHQPSYFAALSAVTAALAGLLDTGRQSRFAVSQQEGLAQALEDALPRLQLRGVMRRRQGNRLDDGSPLTDLYATRDGAVSLCVYIEPQWESLCAMVDRVEWRDDPRFAGWALRAANGAEIKTRLEEWFAERGSEEVLEILQALRIPSSILRSPRDLLVEPQALARDGLRDIRLESGRKVTAPVLPWLSEVEPVAPGSVPAPGSVTLPRPGGRAANPVEPLDFSRIRVLDLTHAWAGPFGTEQLADLGADVIRIESAIHPDVTRLGHYSGGGGSESVPPFERGTWYQQYSRNKRSLAIEVTKPEGNELFMRLVAVSDVVVDNFSTRVMPQLGLDFERLSAVNPRIVQVRLTGFGATGPLTNAVAYGESLEAATGTVYQTVSRGRPVRSGIAYPDCVGGHHGAIAILAGLVYRQQTGRGVLIDVSEREATMRLAGEAIAEASAGVETWRQEHSEDPIHAPSGVYPCAGDERWVTLLCRTEEAWSRLALLARLHPGAYPNVAERRAARAEIDEAIADWTRGMEREEAVATLRRIGVEAEPVLDLRELIEGRQLWEAGFFARVRHPYLGEFTLPGSPITRDGKRLPVRHAPIFGEHTDEVLRELIGLSDAEIGRYATAGAIKGTPRVDG